MTDYLSKTCERGLHDVCTGFSPVSGELCRCSCECRTRVHKDRKAAAEAANRALVAATREEPRA